MSDFQQFRLYELDTGLQHDFTLAELPERLHLFGFITGYRPAGQQRPEDPANAEAAELMAQRHDALLADGYAGHPLEVLLVRLLFCLFAEDTAIFDKDEFRALLEEHTASDGHDLGAKLGEFFAVLAVKYLRSLIQPSHVATTSRRYASTYHPHHFVPAAPARRAAHLGGANSVAVPAT